MKNKIQFSAVALMIVNIALNAGDVLSGVLNTSTSNLSVVVGGEDNHNNVDLTGDSDYSTIGGGKSNHIKHGTYGVLAGGRENGLSSAMYGVVGGGFQNVGIKSFVTIAGGKRNHAQGRYSTISGGALNLTLGENSTVAGGVLNQSTGMDSFSVGRENIASGDYSVAMGYKNQATNLQSVAFGRENISSGVYSLTSGRKNKAFGHGSVAMGNYSETHGFVSFTFGKEVKAGQDGTVVFGDSNGGHNGGATGTFPLTERASDLANRFYGFFENGYKLYTTAGSSGGSGVYINGGGGAWNTLSDKNQKENYEKIDKQEVLNKLIAIPMEKWNYKAQDKKVKHIGPYAQDFNKAYGLGDGKLSISTIDSDGIALTSIQALAERNKRLNEKNKALETKVNHLEARFSKLEKLLQ